MKHKVLWIAVPLLLGLLVAAFTVAVPAHAGQLIQASDPTDHHPPPGESAFGLVESFPEGLFGSWTISGVVYTATQSTYFGMFGGPFYVGACVYVRYNPADYTAYKIGTIDSEKCGNDAELRFIGIIEQVPQGFTETLHHDPPGISGTWMISGTEFVSTFDTELKTKNGPLVVGACASVEYRVVNGVNVADEIRSEWIYRCYPYVSFNQAYGYVDTFPEDLVGAWVISDTAGISLTFMTTPASRVSEHHYPLETGACVRVKYYTDQGVNIAAYVKTTNPRHCEGFLFDWQPPSKIYAVVDSRPPTGTYTGTWMLAGVNFTATEQTRFEEDEGPLAVGSCAEGKYDPTNGAMLLRKLEGEEAEDCQAEDGTPRFKLFGVIEMLPGAGYTGTWQVSGVTFSVTPSTTLESRHGDFAIGAYVKVYFTYDLASGERTAQLVKTHCAPGYGRFNHRGRFGGWIHQTWGDQVILDGKPLPADPDIDAPANLKEGDLVWMNVYQDGSETYVTQISLDQSVFLPLVR
jgi:hypothetical protein